MRSHIPDAADHGNEIPSRSVPAQLAVPRLLHRVEGQRGISIPEHILRATSPDHLESPLHCPPLFQSAPQFSAPVPGLGKLRRDSIFDGFEKHLFRERALVSGIQGLASTRVAKQKGQPTSPELILDGGSHGKF